MTDTNGNRIVEVTPQGKIVWTVAIGLPYEAERLETGDESTNGPSSQRLAPGPSDVDSRSGVLEGIALTLKELISGILFILPAWMGTLDYLAGCILLGSLLSWLGLELYWRSGRVRGVLSLRNT